MSRKKLKAFDPGNSNKAQRDAYQKLQEGSIPRDLAPRHSDDSNRLTGAARRFAMQLLVSSKLDARDRAIAQGKKVIAQPDYKKRLEEQIALKRAQQAKTHAKAAKRAEGNKISSNEGKIGTLAAATSAPKPATNHPQGVVSLSKTVEQQRQAKRDRLAHAKSQAKLNADRHAAVASTAGVDAQNESASAEEDEEEEEHDGKPVQQKKIQFSTEMRPGESFRSYQARLVQEKSRLMNAEVVHGPRGLSERKKRKLEEKEERRKEKKFASIDPAERRVREERESKDRLDAERGFHVAKLPETEGRAKEFDEKEEIKFGEVADRPPTLTALPKSKTLQAKLDADRIIDGLLLMQQKKRKSKGQPEMDEVEKQEWIEKQRDLSRRTQAAAAAKEREIDHLREASLKAYKESRKRKREEEINQRAAATSKEQPYVKKSVLKKQKRNRERMQAFKEQQDLKLDMEIEMADNYH